MVRQAVVSEFSQEEEEPSAGKNLGEILVNTAFQSGGDQCSLKGEWGALRCGFKEEVCRGQAPGAGAESGAGGRRGGCVGSSCWPLTCCCCGPLAQWSVGLGWGRGVSGVQGH